MKIHRWLLPQFLAALAGILMFGGSAYASSTAGIIKGVVIDDGGLPLPGVLVTLSSPALIGGTQQRETDDDGRFLFVELPPGQYEIASSKPGFSSVTKKGVPVGIGRTVELTLEMKYGGADVTVYNDRPVVDTESTSTGQSFNSDFLSRIPTGRSYQDVVAGAAGVVDNGSGNPNSGGASYNENTFMLDGVNITDPVTGTFSMNFNFDSLDEVNVTTTGFDPEYNSLGATISLDSKSGGNTMKTGVAGYYSNGNWSPRYDAQYAADGTTLAPTSYDTQSQSVDLSMDVSGPLLKDRIWFYGSYGYQRYIRSLSGVRTPRDYTAHYFYGKLTAQPSSAHRIALSFQADPTTVDNLSQSRWVLPEAQRRQAQGGFFSALKWNFFPSPKVTTELTAAFQKSYLEGSGVACTHDQGVGYNPCEPDEQENAVDFTTPGRLGFDGAYYSQNYTRYDLDDRYTATLKGKLNVLELSLAGSHDVKVGFDLSNVWWERVLGFPGNLLFVDHDSVPYDPATIESAYWEEVTGPYVYHATGFHGAAFLADSYKPIENLTIFAGLRYDMSHIENDVGFPVVGEGVWGPRISLSWDPFADQKTKIFGGYGRFNDVGTLGLSSYIGQSGLGEKLILGAPYGGGATSEGQYVYFNIDEANTTQLAPNLSTPHEDAFVLGADREVMPDTMVSVHFTAKFTRGVYAQDETNLIYDEDGYSYVGSSNGRLEAIYRIRTPTISRRDYYQTDVSFQRNFAKRWQALLTYSYVVSKGTMQDGLGAGLSNPSQVDLNYGNLETDIRHQVKLGASWDIPNDPWTTKIGASGDFYSGSPLSRYYYAPAGELYSPSGGGYGLLRQPVGTYGRTEPTYSLAIQVTQDIPVKKGKLVLYGAAENVTNATMANGIDTSYIDYYNRYVVYSKQSPISATLGLKYEF